jgi:hypothetical protein
MQNNHLYFNSKQVENYNIQWALDELWFKDTYSSLF